MAEIGGADLLITPKIKGGLKNYINGEIAKANIAGAGKRAGGGFMSGFTSGASIGIWSAVASKAINVVAGSLDAAASRVDTLNNYPRIMSSLGVETDVANASIQTMSDELQNVPTKLDDMASTVQGLYAATSRYGLSLGTVTDAGLALNSMLLAGGQSTQVVNSAMEQFRQMVSKGKPDLQDWRALISAAPGQLNQLAQEMLGATATADDLYAALGGGKESDYSGAFEWGSLGMDEFVTRFAQLKDKFASDAEDAQGGISTSFANMQNAVTRGVAGVIEAFGQDRISGAINDIKGGINGAFKGIQSTAQAMQGPVTKLWSAITYGAQTAAPVVSATWDVFSAGLVTITDFAGDAVEGVTDIFRYGLEGSATGENKVRAFRDAIGEVSGVAKTSGAAVDVMGGTIRSALETARESTRKAKEAHEGYLETLARSSDAIREADAAHEAEVARMEYAASVIDTYAGKTNLTSAEMRELEGAISTVNEACGTQYGLVEGTTTVIDNETGVIQTNTEEIWNNVRAREAASRADALGATKLEVDESFGAAAVDYQSQKAAAQDAAEAWQLVIDKYGSYKAAMEQVNAGMNAGNRTTAQAEAFEAWQMWDNATNGMHEAERAECSLKQTSSELAAEQQALYKIAEGGEATIADLALSSGIAATTFNDSMLSITDFADALSGLENDHNSDALRKKLADPDAMAKLVAAYDGTAMSLEDAFKSIGVSFDETAAKAMDAQGTITQMADWLVEMGDEGYDAMARLGMSSDDMAGKLRDAGVSMEMLSSVGQEQFGTMLQECGGDLSQLSAMVALYNQQGVEDKDGKISVDKISLVDAEGEVYTWNGAELLDKDSTVVAEDKALRDAYGNLLLWNNKTLKTQNANVLSSRNDIPGVMAWIRDWESKDGKVVKTYTENTTTNTTYNVVRNTTGTGSSQLTMATGGHVVPRHASGYIATGPTYTNFGLVGEAGTEAVLNSDDGSSTVVPLTNRKYAQPFVDLLVEGIHKAMSGHAEANQTFNVYANDPALVASVVASRQRRAGGFA